MLKTIVTRELAAADIIVGGKRPWDIQVVRERFYLRAVFFGSLGFGDSYAEGDFTCMDIGQMLEKYLRYLEAKKVKRVRAGKPPRTLLPTSLPDAWIKLQLEFCNPQSIAKAKKAISHHYDIGNELYYPMLGRTLAYSCGYWAGANDNDRAQENKYRHICEKAQLKPGMRVLEIGSGWGGFAAYAVKHYGVTLVGVALAREQVEGARRAHASLCESGQLEFHYMDYRSMRRELAGEFDVVISIGMFEHVGPVNYNDYFRIAWSMLREGGRFILHSIVGNGGVDPFIWFRIFPGGVLPVEEQIARAVKPYFVVEHVENFGFDYSKTLMAWWKNFSMRWHEISRVNPKYDLRFYRMWEFYLKSCAMAFRVRRIHLQQWVLAKGGTPGGYQWNRPVHSHALAA